MFMFKRVTANRAASLVYPFCFQVLRLGPTGFLNTTVSSGSVLLSCQREPKSLSNVSGTLFESMPQRIKAALKVKRSPIWHY